MSSATTVSRRRDRRHDRSGPGDFDTVVDGLYDHGGKAETCCPLVAACSATAAAASAATVSNLLFSFNQAAYGAARSTTADRVDQQPDDHDDSRSGQHRANGGAIYDDGSRAHSNPSIANVTFFGNGVTSCGGAIYDDASGFGTSSPQSGAQRSPAMADSANGGGSAICDFTATGVNATTLTTQSSGAIVRPEISTYSGGMTLDHVVLQENACPNGVTCLTAPIGTNPQFGPLQTTVEYADAMPGVAVRRSDAGLDSACMGPPVNALDQRVRRAPWVRIAHRRDRRRPA